MGYYNWRVTGHPLTMPFMLYEKTYTLAPVFVWQQPLPLPEYRHKAMSDFYDHELADYMEQHSISGFMKASEGKLAILWLFYEGIRSPRWSLILPLLALPWIACNRWTRFGIATLALFVLALIALTWHGAHYAPPIAGVVIFLSLQAARSLRLWRWGKVHVGRFLMWSLAAVTIFTFSAYFVAAFVDKLNDHDPTWHFERARLNEELGRGGRHLIIVRYGANHDPYQEWVYNDADIDGAHVVWAREMSPAEDKKLISYFKDRKVWLLNVDNDELPVSLVPYPTTSPQ
jgi:hypothetical protein